MTVSVPTVSSNKRKPSYTVPGKLLRTYRCFALQLFVFSLLASAPAAAAIQTAEVMNGQGWVTDYSFILDGPHAMPTLLVTENFQQTMYYDLEVKLTFDNQAATGYLIGFDKEVMNSTGEFWPGFRASVGYGAGESFDYHDGLYIVDSPYPENNVQPQHLPYVTHEYGSPMVEFWGPPGLPDEGTMTKFWLGVYIPHDMLVQDAATGEYSTYITIRQEPVVPEPATFIVWSLLGLSAVVVKGRRNRQM